MNKELHQQLEAAKKASYQIATLPTETKNQILEDIAKLLVERNVEILEANKKDLTNFEPNDSLYDRALLTEERIEAIAGDTRNVAGLEDPVGEVMEEKKLNNGLLLQKKRVAMGVTGIIYEARPNVTIDAAVICIKSGNAVLLRGSSNTFESNSILVSIMRDALEKNNVDPNVVQLLDTDRELVTQMLTADGYLDIVIPRGSQKLIDHVRKTATVPVIETGAGVVHTYVDEFADAKKAVDIVFNAKVQRPSVCNCLDTLVIHQKMLDLVLGELSPLLSEKGVVIYADAESKGTLAPSYPKELLFDADEEHFGQEFLSLKMSVKTVTSLDEAIDHVRKYSSKHSEAIVSEDKSNIERYLNEIDAAAVFANVSTRFTDGAQFQLGTEIGISTQKLHARGPMGLREMTSYKWVIRGDGQIIS